MQIFFLHDQLLNHLESHGSQHCPVAQQTTSDLEEVLSESLQGFGLQHLIQECHPILRRVFAGAHIHAWICLTCVVYIIYILRVCVYMYMHACVYICIFIHVCVRESMIVVLLS